MSTVDRRALLRGLRAELQRLSEEVSELPDWALVQIGAGLTVPRAIADGLLAVKRAADERRKVEDANRSVA